MGFSDFSQTERERFRVGNATFGLSVQLLEICLAHNVHLHLENPRISIIWWTDQMRSPMKSH
eukprot:2273203-Pyramimonas_sp.AAC.1